MLIIIIIIIIAFRNIRNRVAKRTNMLRPTMSWYVASICCNRLAEALRKPSDIFEVRSERGA